MTEQITWQIQAYPRPGTLQWDWCIAPVILKSDDNQTDAEE